MRYFEQHGNELIWRNKGETLIISPWGENSLRVRSALQGDVMDTRFALLEPEAADVEIIVEDEHASIRCGKLTADVEVDGWHHLALITFLNQKGEVLLRETATGNALGLRSRKFEPHLGGDFAFVVETDNYTTFANDWVRPLIRPLDNRNYRFGRATHGHLPHKGPQPTLVAFGPHMKPGVVLSNAQLVDEAPTIAHALGLVMGNTDGRCLTELFKE